MNSKVLECPPKPTNIPNESVGKLTYNALKSYDQNATALVNLGTGEFYTFGNVVDYSLNLAAGLKNLGIVKDDCLAIISENSHKFSIAALAGLYLAAPVHLLNPGYTKYEIKKILDLSKPKLVFCSNKSLKNLLEVRKELHCIETVVLLDDNAATNFTYNYGDLIKTCSNNFKIENNFDCNDQVAMIFNSSGTTGPPKGVMLTHENLRLTYVYDSDDEFHESELNESVVLVLPTFHLYGFALMLASLYVGANCLVMDQFNPQLYLESIEKYGVKKLFVVPSLANFLAKTPIVANFDVSSVEEIYSAAAPPSEEILKLLAARFNTSHVRHMYGLTELCATTCLTPKTGGKKGSCGKLLPGRCLKILDTKTQEILGANQPGELCIKGSLMKGYVNDPIRTKETIDNDGFLHTGDVGYYDQEGYVYIIDRLKDLIKYKSFQVAPVELEDILLGHPAIQDVAVVGKPDERAGELPVAFVVKNEEVDVEEKDIVDFVAEQVCVEKRLHGGVKFVDHIPKNQIGKILRMQLREML